MIIFIKYGNETDLNYYYLLVSYLFSQNNNAELLFLFQAWSQNAVSKPFPCCFWLRNTKYYRNNMGLDLPKKKLSLNWDTAVLYHMLLQQAEAIFNCS